ncbi:MAG: DUF4062 domain-containing protein [Clostridiales bacterium]|nr:DUF4062 domain-containing protein [Clostridiales bacterium]
MNNRIIRVFLSSTFRDFQLERNQLNRYVFPELETYCRKQGVSFHVIDLRWGIPEQSANNNETMQICLDEIERCQKLSPNINFLILSGTRYGWRPLPGFISKTDRKQLYAKMTNEERELFNKWYLSDENDPKGAYVLRKRTKKEEAGWGETEKALQEILFPLAEQCLEGEAKISYGLSATEQEIYKGFLNVVNESSLKNTLILLKNPVSDGSGSERTGEEPEPGVAELRAKIIKHVGKENANEQIFEYDIEGEENNGDSRLIKKVYDFLFARINRQIAEIKLEETEEEEKERFLGEISFAEKSFIHRPSMEQAFEEFLSANRGKVILFKGESGAGKSTWLKHWYYNSRKSSAACFSDTLHYGKSILYAARFCISQLAEQGFLKAPAASPDYENLVSWFNENLNRVKSSETVTVILDSLDNMEDSKMITGSLFGMKLNKNVRVLISCADGVSLTEEDKRKAANVFCWELLDREESREWLDAYLNQAGRRLCQRQKAEIISAMPKRCTALYIYFLSVLCASLKSFEPIDFVLPESAKAIAGLLLSRQAKGYYPVLYRHAAGYLALSSEGLSEQEILELLSSDTDVISEIKAQTEWNWDERLHIPMVLWSRLYCMIMPLMTERYSGGVLTMGFRHSLLNEVCLSETEEGMLQPGERKKLLVRMKDYFESPAQPWKYLSGAVNIRKLQELYPILVKLEDFIRIGRLLSEPNYTEAMILAGRYYELIDQLLLYKENRSLSDIQERILSLLLSRPVLFQTWKECFISNAVGSGIWNPKGLETEGQFAYLEEKTDEPETQEKMFYIPNIHRHMSALRKDLVLAVFIIEGKNGRIQLYDLENGRNLRISALFRENTSMSEGFWLFWRGDYLIVRTKFSRHYFRYIKESGDFYEESRVSLKGWGQLLKRDEIISDTEEIWEANVFNHKSSNDEDGFWCVSCYGEDGFSKYALPYDDRDNLQIFCFYKKAAVLKAGGYINVFDLENKTETAHFYCPGCMYIFWSDSGRELIIVRENDYVSILPAGSEGKKYFKKNHRRAAGKNI